MALAVPRHKVDGPSRYILPQDSAWDHERIAKERSELPAGSTHPYDEYQRGETRFDLAQVQGYLRTHATPVVWHLRRLSFDEWLSIQQLLVVDATIAAYRALQFGVMKIEGIEDLGIRLEGADLDPPRLTAADVTALDGPLREYLLTVGHAVVKLSRGLTEGERRPSGS